MGTVIKSLYKTLSAGGCGVYTAVCSQQLLIMNETSMERVLLVEVTP